MNTIQYKDEWGTEYEIRFEKAEYVYGGLAIEAHCRELDEEWWEPYGNLTVNLVGYFTPPNGAFLDTNNVRSLCDRVIAEGWAKVVGEGRSGYCTYPMVEFTDEFLNDICGVM